MYTYYLRVEGDYASYIVGRTFHFERVCVKNKIKFGNWFVKIVQNN
jgi:hypothetical protein